MKKKQKGFTNNLIKFKKRLKKRLRFFDKKAKKKFKLLNKDLRKKINPPLTESLERKARKVLKTLSVSFFIMLIIFGTSAAFATATYAYFANDISSPDRLINRNNTGTVIYAKNNEVLYQSFGAKYRELLELQAIPDTMENATIAAEDKDFYKHKGVSTRGLARAFFNDIKAGGIKEGGSSITQQLVKNALLTPERSISRKYKEIVLALEIERKYDKNDILKMYLNEIYYGEGAWGIQDAAKVYFGKEAKDLTLGESSILAGLPAAPSKYSPINNISEAKERQKYVLGRMQELKMITKEQADAAFKEQVVLHGQQTEIKAPHFVMAVLDQANAEYGEDFLEKKGLRIYTSLDMEKQRAAEAAIAKEMPNLKPKRANNASVVSADPKTGEILALVGSADWNNDAWGKVAIPFTDQQPGSSFKPFAYVTALQKGWTAATVIKDEKTNFGGEPAYIPANYDGKFHGNVTLRKALANSYNIPAVKAIEHASLDETINNSKEFGLKTLDKEKYNYGYSLVLGGGDVRLIDMVSAYGTFANGGEYIEPKMIVKVIDNKDKDITKKSSEKIKRVLDPGYAFIMSDILSDNDARKDTFGPSSPLKLSRPAAAKTGTTNDYKDGWTMGYTPNLVTGVWIGNNDNTPMQELPGALGAGYVWNSYMEEALKNMPVENFVKPDNVVEKWITSSGALANAGNWGAKKEYFMPGTEPSGNIIMPPIKPKYEEKKIEPEPPKVEPPKAPEPVPTPASPEPKKPPVQKNKPKKQPEKTDKEPSAGSNDKPPEDAAG